MGCTSSIADADTFHRTIERQSEEPSTPAAASDANFFLKYSLGEALGKGSFAVVHHTTCKSSGQPLAVKIQSVRSRTTGEIDEKYRREVIQEGAAWCKVGRHENVVSLQSAWLHEGVSFFAMELCTTSFRHFLQSGAGEGRLTERSLSRTFHQVLRGVAHIHAMQVVHRDLKPDNLMVHHGVVKVCDFGLAAVLPLGGLQGRYGTAPYMAPEMLKGECYGSSVDLWSLGAMAYVLLYGDFAYASSQRSKRSASELRRAIRDGVQLPSYVRHPSVSCGCWAAGFSGGPSEAAGRFVRALLERRPMERVAAEEAQRSDWIQHQRWPLWGGTDLAPVLAQACRAGAFERRAADVADEHLDPLLRALQLHDESCPESVKAPPLLKQALESATSDASTMLQSCAMSTTSSAHL